MNDSSGSWRPICPPAKGLVRPVRVDPAGLEGPTRGQSRGRKWRQTSYGFFVPADVSDTVPEQRVMEQAVRLPEHGAVTGWASCRLHGAAFFDGLQPDGVSRIPVPLAVGKSTSIRKDERITVSRDRLDADEVATVQGIRATTAVRALFDEMRGAKEVRDAVVANDMMAAAELVSIRQMQAYVATRAGWRGVDRVRSALSLANENSMSPNETRLRLVWVLDAGLPTPLVNQPVFDLCGRLLGIADLFDPVAGLVGEYDGTAHRGVHRHRRDVMREDRFRRAGLEYVKVVALDLRHREEIVDRIHASRRRAAYPSPARRRWALTPPDGWYESPLEAMSLDERREYRAAVHGVSLP